MSSWTAEIEAKWQARWLDARLFEANRDSRPKFMIIFAYPGLTGYLHVGHMRGYTYVDAIARYKRMTTSWPTAARRRCCRSWSSPSRW